MVRVLLASVCVVLGTELRFSLLLSKCSATRASQQLPHIRVKLHGVAMTMFSALWSLKRSSCHSQQVKPSRKGAFLTCSEWTDTACQCASGAARAAAPGKEQVT